MWTDAVKDQLFVWNEFRHDKKKTHTIQRHSKDWKLYILFGGNSSVQFVKWNEINKGQITANPEQIYKKKKIFESIEIHIHIQ